MTSAPSVRELVVDTLRGEPRHLQEVYAIIAALRPGTAEETIRARIYEELRRPQPRVLQVDEGVYVAVDGPATLVMVTGCAWELLERLPDESINLLVSDVAYKWGTDAHINKGTTRPHSKMKGRTYATRDPDETFLRNAFRALKSRHAWRNLKGGTRESGGAMILFGPAEAEDTWPHLRALIDLAERVGFRYQGRVTWVHQRGMGWKVGGVQAEPILVFNKGPRKGVLWDLGFTNVIHADHPRNACKEGTQDHEAEKPPEVFLSLIRAHTRAGDIVLDTHAGSATWAWTAVREGRTVIVNDIDPRWTRRVASTGNHSLHEYVPDQ